MTKIEIDMYAKADLPWKPEVGDRYIVLEPPIRREHLLLVDTFTIEALEVSLKSSRKGYAVIFSTDQLAEMWHLTPGAIFITDLAKFVRKDLIKDGFVSEQSLNIIALHFIMSDIYNKRWVDNEWVRNDNDNEAETAHHALTGE